MSDGLNHSTLQFAAGDVIFKDGDLRTSLFIVQKGQVAIFKITPTNERIPLGIVSSGQYLAETGLIDNKRFHATWAVALTDVELISIPSAAIMEQLKTAPQWLVSLSRGLAQKLRRMNDIVRKNKLTDESLDNAILAAQANEDKRKGDI